MIAFNPFRSAVPQGIGLKNAIIVDVGNDLIAKYNWLKSSDRDAEMGALSATNRRVILLAPGIQTLTAQLTLDTDYVDIAGLTGDPKDATVTRSSGYTIVQTCNVCNLCDFKITSSSSTIGDHGFVVNCTASDNANSEYNGMIFEHDNSGCVERYGVYGATDLAGTWRRCQFDTFNFCVTNNKKISCTMYDCEFAGSAVGASGVGSDDGTGTSITGKFYRCVSRGGYMFGAGLGGAGECADCASNAYFQDCVALDKSWAYGGEFAAIAIRCIGTTECFGGGGTAAIATKFSGKAIDCVARGRRSFGQGDAGCEVSGIAINCRNGFYDDYLHGKCNTETYTLMDNSAAAILATDFTEGANANLTFTANQTGLKGNSITIEFKTVGKGSTSVSVTDLTIIVTFIADEIATNVKTALDGNAMAAALIATALVGNGSGHVEVMSTSNLAGGIDPPYFSNNHPWASIPCTANTIVYEFDNGATYCNTGALGAIEFDLPSATIGLKYTFHRTEEGAGKDVTVDPAGNDTIINIDGTVLVAATKMLENTADDCSQVTLECFTATEWIIVSVTDATSWVSTA